jgi:uncharacterized protein YdhG (YjbR/CyaY superfamily)
MAERKTATKKRRASSTKTDATRGLTPGERAAMKERLKELKAEERASRNRAEGERDVLAAIDAMGPSDRAIAKRLHAIVEAAAPMLWPKTWYGMPAYAKDGKVVCFFKPAEKFNARYATFGFEEAANLDDGDIWVTSFAVKKLTPSDEKKISALVKRAVS